MRIGTYCRVSTDDQKTGMQVYRESVNNFCIRNNHTVSASFEDEDISGGMALKDRPEGAKLYEMAMAHRIDGILADNVSRMFRDMEDGISMANRFREAGIKVFFTDYGSEPIDIETESGFLWFVMQLTMAHIERMKIKKRTSDAHRMRRRNGLATSHAPYGYDKVDGRIIENNEEMTVVRFILLWRQDGESYDMIARRLNESDRKPKKGGQWSAKTIRDVVLYQEKLKAGK